MQAEGGSEIIWTTALRSTCRTWRCWMWRLRADKADTLRVIEALRSGNGHDDCQMIFAMKTRICSFSVFWLQGCGFGRESQGWWNPQSPDGLWLSGKVPPDELGSIHMDSSRTFPPLEVHFTALRLAGGKTRSKAALQNVIYLPSTPCSLWPLLVSAEMLSDLHICCLKSKYQFSTRRSALILENEQPLVFHGLTCSNNTCRLHFPIALRRLTASSVSFKAGRNKE